MSANLTDRVVALFISRPNRWIDAHEIAKAGGFAGWRSRISDARARGMSIRNHQRTVRTADGVKVYRVTEYMFMPRPPATLLEIAEAQNQEAAC